jgi:hypothetical protein
MLKELSDQYVYDKCLRMLKELSDQYVYDNCIYHKHTDQTVPLTSWDIYHVSTNIAVPVLYYTTDKYYKVSTDQTIPIILYVHIHVLMWNYKVLITKNSHAIKIRKFIVILLETFVWCFIHEQFNI